MYKKEQQIQMTCKEARELVQKEDRIMVHWRPGLRLSYSDPDNDLAVVTVFE